MTLIRVEQGDISEFPGDAVVNAANNHLRMGAGVAGALLARGGWAIQEACDAHVKEHGPLAVGQAALTTGGELPARYVIHAAAMGDEPASAESIAAATRASLELAEAHGVRTLALPVLGTGVGAFPFETSARIMLDEVQAFVERRPQTLDSVVFYGYLPEQAEALRRLLA